MNSADLGAYIAAGNTPVVTFKNGVGEHETCIDAGMRGRIIGIQPDRHGDGGVTVIVDLSEFEAVNAQFETRNYYDERGNPTMTAREAGFYRSEETIWLDPKKTEIAEFDVEDGRRVELYQAYLQAGSDRQYLQWLEDRVLDAHEPMAVKAPRP